jgi:predicted GIY-YIG superfamily endonuclease
MHKRLGAILETFKDWPLGWVYAIRDAGGAVVYVGATEDLDERILAHKRDLIHQQPLRQWVRDNPHTFSMLSTHATKRAMLDAERIAIKAMRPRFNRT